MLRILISSIVMILIQLTAPVFAQQLDGNPYTLGKDADIDMYMGSWKESMPIQTHGSLIERSILARGVSINPVSKGKVLEYIKRFSFATLDIGSTTQPTLLKGEQEILFILSGKGIITAGGKKEDLFKGIAVLVPANLSFTLQNTCNDPMTMYLVNEPIPENFRPNKELLVRNENTLPISSTNVHWCHIDRTLFKTSDGLGTLEYITTCGIAPMTIGQPHSHVKGVEEVWTVITGSNIAFLGKQIRNQQPGTAYMIPPDGMTPHSNINVTDNELKFFYFARYGDHELRK
jgi:mannose-6-phosphate isomerase-like protein (cupin superfamily)